MPNRQAAAGSQPGCPSQCNALSSLYGKQAVWGVAGNEMQLVSNTGGIIQRLRVTHSGAPPSCVPVSWWNATTVLANCAAQGQPNANSEGLWLVPTNGATARALVPPSGSPSGTGFEAGAWIVGGHVYLTQTSTRQCPGAAPGPGGLAVLAVGQGGSLASVTIPGSKHNHDNVVAAAGDRLLVLAQTSCPGTSSLLSVSPSPLAAKTLLPGTAGELGVVAAAPYGGWSTAYSLGY
jgi:hypothetical protein